MKYHTMSLNALNSTQQLSRYKMFIIPLTSNNIFYHNFLSISHNSFLYQRFQLPSKIYVRVPVVTSTNLLHFLYLTKIYTNNTQQLPRFRIYIIMYICTINILQTLINISFPIACNSSPYKSVRMVHDGVRQDLCHYEKLN